MTIAQRLLRYKRPYFGTINYTLGASSTGSVGSDGGDGNDSTLRYNGVFLFAGGGEGGTDGLSIATQGTRASGGIALGGLYNFLGGCGGYNFRTASDNGGGGGCFFSLLDSNGSSTGGISISSTKPYTQLVSALSGTGVSLSTTRATSTATATDIGGGAGFVASTTGRNGNYGGGGSGADGSSLVPRAGGAGGAGILVLEFLDDYYTHISTAVLTTGTSYNIPSNTYGIRCWLFGGGGAGGGGGSSSTVPNNNGGGGGGGGCAYYEWL